MRIYKILFIVLLLLLVACRVPVVTDTTDTPFTVKKVLVLPFRDMAKVYGEDANVRCPVCGNVVVTGKVAQSAAEFLTNKLFLLLQNDSDFELIPPEQAHGVQSNILSQDQSILSEYQMLIATGRALKADAVMVGYIFRFKERVGTTYSVESPASVAFEIHLIRIADRRVLWSGHFNETQRSLSEDLFKLGAFIKRKGQWITAREMAEAGLEETLQSLSGFKPPSKRPE